MKKNDLADVKNLNIKALKEKVKTAKQEVDSLIMDKNMSKLKDLKSISKKRRDIAQMLTVMKQKELLEALSGKGEGDKDLKTQSSNVKTTTKNLKAGKTKVKKGGSA